MRRVLAIFIVVAGLVGGLAAQPGLAATPALAATGAAPGRMGAQAQASQLDGTLGSSRAGWEATWGTGTDISNGGTSGALYPGFDFTFATTDAVVMYSGAAGAEWVSAIEGLVPGPAPGASGVLANLAAMMITLAPADAECDWGALSDADGTTSVTCTSAALAAERGAPAFFLSATSAAEGVYYTAYAPADATPSTTTDPAAGMAAGAPPVELDGRLGGSKASWEAMYGVGAIMSVNGGTGYYYPSVNILFTIAEAMATFGGAVGGEYVQTVQLVDKGGMLSLENAVTNLTAVVVMIGPPDATCDFDNVTQPTTSSLEVACTSQILMAAYGNGAFTVIGDLYTDGAGYTISLPAGLSPAVPAASTTAAGGDVPYSWVDLTRTGVMPGPGPTDSPVQLWSFPTGFEIWASPAIVDGVAYLASTAVHAIDIATGQEIWRFETRDVNTATPAVVDGVVYATSEDGNLYAIDAGTGTVRWTFAARDWLRSSPAVVNGIVYFGGSDGYVYAVDAATGSLVWESAISIGTGLVSDPAFLDGVLYITSMDGNLYAINAENGATWWTYETASPQWSIPAISDGLVFITSQTGWLYAVNALTGEEAWKYRLTIAAMANAGCASPTVADGVVYAMCALDGLTAVSAATGQELWNAERWGGGDGPASIAQGVLYVANSAGDLYAVDAATGAELWSIDLEGTRAFALPVVVDGVIYWGNQSGNLYAIGGGGMAPQPTVAAEPTGKAGNLGPATGGAVAAGAELDGRLGSSRIVWEAAYGLPIDQSVASGTTYYFYDVPLPFTADGVAVTFGGNPEAIGQVQVIASGPLPDADTLVVNVTAIIDLLAPSDASCDFANLVQDDTTITITCTSQALVTAYGVTQFSVAVQVLDDAVVYSLY